MPTAEPHILRASTRADFLASVPAICGFTARNSVVVVPFAGKQGRGAFRFDLPIDDRTATTAALAKSIPEFVRRMPGTDGVAVIVYTDGTFAERRGTPHLELWRAIRPRLRKAGFAVKEAAVVAADGWASYLDPGRPLGGRPLDEITGSRMALEAAYHVDRIADLDAWSSLPDPDPRIAQHVATAIDDLVYFGERLDAFGVAHPYTPDPVSLAERMLSTPAHELGIDTLAEIIVTCDAPALRDVLLIALAGGRERGENALRFQLDAYERQAATGESFDEQALADIGKRPDDDDLIMVGRSRFRPNAKHLQASIEALRRAAAHAPRPRRAGPLCVLAWMLWARGLMSPASQMQALAYGCDPDLRMVETIEWLLSSGPPEWGYRAATDVQS